MSYWGKKNNNKKKPNSKEPASKSQTKKEIAPPAKLEKSKSTPLEFASAVNLNDNESEFVTFLIQTRALIWKNYLLFSRKMRILIFMLITPIAVGFMLDLIIQMGKVLHNSGVVDFPVEPIVKLNFCDNGYYFDKWKEEECLTVGYSMIGDSKNINDPKYQRYHDLMEIFATNNGFKFGKDVKPLTAGNQRDLYNHFEAKPNKTAYAVLFCHEYWQEELEYTSVSSKDMYNFNLSLEERMMSETNRFNWSFPCTFEQKEYGDKDMWVYFMFYNMTLAPSNLYTSIDKPMKKDPQLLALKLGLDNALLEYKAKQKGLGWIPKIKQHLQAFPYVPDRVFKDLDVISMYGAFYLLMVPLCVFTVFFDELMREKADKLRLGM